MRQLALCAALLLASWAGDAPAATDDCLSALQTAERAHQLPHGLLLAMALVESGRTDPDTGLVTPWPWTVHRAGQGYFFDSAEEARRDVRTSLAAGDALVDVGCLQVDLFHHPAAFRSLDEAFDPARNVDYAARYLSALAHEHGSWLEAVAAYNAGRSLDGVDYLSKVLYRWRGIRLTAAGRQTTAFLTPLP